MCTAAHVQDSEQGLFLSTVVFHPTIVGGAKEQNTGKFSSDASNIS